MIPLFFPPHIRATSKSFRCYSQYLPRESDPSHCPHCYHPGPCFHQAWILQQPPSILVCPQSSTQRDPKMDPILPLLRTLPASQLTQNRSQRSTLIFKSSRDKSLPTSFTPSATALSLLHSAPALLLPQGLCICYSHYPLTYINGALAFSPFFKSLLRYHPSMKPSP